MKTHLLSALLLLFFTGCLSGQHRQDFPDPGMSWRVGYSLKSELLPEGYLYSPLFLLGRYRVKSYGVIHLFVETQAAQAFNPGRSKADYELGINAGVCLQLPLSPLLRLQAALGSGPHFITVQTHRQARGFIFSDNAELGLSYHARRHRLVLHLTARYRHISNAGLREPNGGIDNGFLIFGLARTL